MWNKPCGRPWFKIKHLLVFRVEQKLLLFTVLIQVWSLTKVFTWNHKPITLLSSLFPAQCCLKSLQTHGSMYLCGCNHECPHPIASINCKGPLLNTVHIDTEHLFYLQSLRLYGRMCLDLMDNLLYLFFFFFCTREDETGRAKSVIFTLQRLAATQTHNRPYRDHQICAFWADSKKIQSVRLIKWLQNWKLALRLLFKSKIGHIHFTSHPCFVLVLLRKKKSVEPSKM